MVARLEACLVEACLAVALLLAVGGSAGAASLQPSVGTTPADPAAAAAAAAANANIAPYSQAGITDPYNQPDFSSQQSFGLTASQMLGAAAACEQLHSDQVSMSERQIAKAGRGASEAERADIDAAQQYQLDPAATAAKSGEADCDRMSTSFSQLQQIQFRNQSLAKDLDQPDAIEPKDNQSQ